MTTTAPPYKDWPADTSRPKTVLCHGVYDVIHLGHIRHFAEARALGDRLVVSITADRHVRKGAGRPHFSAEQRREALLKLKDVDEVVISESGTAIETIKRLRPAVYAKGPDYADANVEELPDSFVAALKLEVEAIESVGGRFVTTTAEKWSSSKLLRSVRLPDSALVYLDSARESGFLDKILAAFEEADKLRIVFVGETIIDEYRYVRPLAKPSKEFILATVDAGGEDFRGGVIAASKQGEWKNKGVVTHVKSITKTRFVDADFSRKLFEVYSAREIGDLGDVSIGMTREIEAADVVVALDFGHGFFDAQRCDLLQKAKFLALTVQSNAGNWGFNPVSRHKRAHYIAIDEPEARLALGMQHQPIEDVAGDLWTTMGRGRAVTVTRGRYGSFSVGFGAPSAAVPAFAEAGFDTMGAGDAFISVAAPLVASGLPVEMAAFAGNVAGGLKTSILGHRQHITRDDVVKNIEWLLK